jgi:hypothetical protein
MTVAGYAFEYDSGTDLKVEGHRTSTLLEEGQETDLDENIDIRYAGRAMKIMNGRLSEDGKDLGAVKPGDRIALTQTGQVFVNGAAR